MTDLLVYWRDCRRNREDANVGDQRAWHSSSRYIGALLPGDRMWLVSSGETLGLSPRTHGFVVEVWKVDAVAPNPGDMPAYPSDRYRFRVIARLDESLSPSAPRKVDAVIRPRRSPADAPIGRLLQGPRRLADEAVEQLHSLLAQSAIRGRVDREFVGGPTPRGLDPGIIALGVRQPWAELILLGRKTIEVRTLETNVRGTIYLYTSKVVADIPAARRAIEDHSLDIDRLPRGCLVGRVNLVSCRAGARRDADAACLPAAMMKSRFAWELAEPVRFPEPVRPRFLPYGVWFYPFRKRNRETSE